MCNYCSLRQDCTFKSQEGICSAFITRIQFISSSHFFTSQFFRSEFYHQDFTLTNKIPKCNNAAHWTKRSVESLMASFQVFVCVFGFCFCFVLFLCWTFALHCCGDACISCGKPNSLLFCRSPPYLCLEQHATLPYQKGIKVSSTFPFLIFRLKAVHRMYTPLLA